MKIVCHFSNGYCGCDIDEEYELDDGMTEKEINEYCYDEALDYAERYSHAAFGGDAGEISEEDWGWYIESIDYYWEEI